MPYINGFRGWKTDRKIVVIESDDWGAIRMPSTEILKSLLKKGVELHPELGYDNYDTLSSNSDIECLLEVLSSVKDMNGNPTKITLNYIMTNPDFPKIKESNFAEYHYELFIETLARYPNHYKSFNLIKEGIKQRLFTPQFHGREHLNVPMWLNALRNNYPGVRESFDSNIFCSYIDKSVDNRCHFLSAYNIKVKEEYDFIQKSIQEGLQLFEEVFGFKSESMIAPNYIWDVEAEEAAHNGGVNILQGSIYQVYSEYNKDLLKRKGNFHYLGERNNNGQVYLVRNCLFEPSQNSSLGYGKCLSDINIAFKLKKPAIISSHRLNFIGELNIENRIANLKQFKKLLQVIKKKYPNVEFMSSDELGNLIINLCAESAGL